MKLQTAWNKRLKLRAEGDKLRAESYKLWAESDKLRVEGYKLRAESDKLRAESYKLRAESDRLWAESVLETHGNITLEWKNWVPGINSYECHLGTGEVFK